VHCVRLEAVEWRVLCCRRSRANDVHGVRRALGTPDRPESGVGVQLYVGSSEGAVWEEKLLFCTFKKTSSLTELLVSAS
jgi:hypothetical protein